MMRRFIQCSNGGPVSGGTERLRDVGELVQEWREYWRGTGRRAEAQMDADLCQRINSYIFCAIREAALAPPPSARNPRIEPESAAPAPTKKQMIDACESCETCGFHAIDRCTEYVRKLFAPAPSSEEGK